MNKKITKKSFLFLFFVLALSFSSVSSKLAGLAWLMVVCAGVMAAWGARGGHRGADTVGSDLALVWLGCAAVALVVKAIPMFYWHDRWEERHAEFRLLMGAVGTYALCRWRSPVSNTQQMGVVWAMGISCALAFCLMLTVGRDAAPTNAIPWAVGMALFGACLLAWSLSPDLTRMNRSGSLAGALLGLGAVLVSESRGAYGLALLWLVLVFVHAKDWAVGVFLRHNGAQRLTRYQIIGLALGAMLCLGLLTQSAVLQRPLQRLQMAVQEIQLSQKSLEAGSNTSVGARLLMWNRSVPFIAESLWLGHGQAARKMAITSWAREANSTEVLSLGHVHNEYLHTLMDHGLWGLASLLFYALGMLWICIRLWHSNLRPQAWAMGGVLFIHSTAELTNVNFAHNYYPTMLSLVIGFVLISACRPLPKTGALN
ncbi:O-antigen ligase [Limnohabitans sp. Jir72]|uniref:O-antigen ligase family protein n=1 Tax=Limnohabitans sp. Jir72 TaxID=1977909 RepID=UPI000D3DB1D8|nr:O-antigen ligase family protein [Limnohabitans sp. Jir72]PUE33985.1 hypothetical protein B9Z52_07825 [Limnohabitans sp. Jir72]